MRRRIEREKAEYLENQIQGVTVQYVKNNPNEIYFTIQGPKGTPYYGGQFNYKLTFPDNYPFRAPMITSLQEVFHYSNYRSLINGCNCCSHIDFKSRQSKWLPNVSRFYHYIEYIKQCFYEEYFTKNDFNTRGFIYSQNRQQFIFQIKNTIAQEKAKEQLKQYLVFSKYIKQILTINPDQVFIDLYF
ncbi:hypothetical protein ABPG74_011622 [Tetrahymena malaccensis]